MSDIVRERYCIPPIRLQNCVASVDGEPSRKSSLAEVLLGVEVSFMPARLNLEEYPEYIYVEKGKSHQY